MCGESVWLSMTLDRVRSELDSICVERNISRGCNLVLESLVESNPVWFEGKKKRTIVASVLYISLLISRRPRRGVLREVLDAVGVSKVSLSDAVSSLVEVDWDLGVVYLSPKLYASLRKRVALPDHVVPLRLSDVMRAKLSRVTPGLYEFLDVQCRKKAGKDCVTTLLEEPKTIRDILVSRYGSPVIARRVAERVFASVIDVLGVERSPSELAELFISDPEELRRVIASNASRLK